MIKRFFVSFLVLVFACSLLASDVLAWGGGKKKGGHMDLEKKVFFKARIILKNKGKLKLTDDQVKLIKNLKMDTKKDLIRKKADIEILAIDIKKAMMEDPINEGALYGLIYKKYDLKKAKTKALVGAYITLKNTLTEEQKKTMKGIWKKCKKKQARAAKKKDKKMGRMSGHGM